MIIKSKHDYVHDYQIIHPIIWSVCVLPKFDTHPRAWLWWRLRILSPLLFRFLILGTVTSLTVRSADLWRWLVVFRTLYHYPAWKVSVGACNSSPNFERVCPLYFIYFLFYKFSNTGSYEVNLRENIANVSWPRMCRRKDTKGHMVLANNAPLWYYGYMTIWLTSWLED